MYIKATEKLNTPSHSLKKGDVVNMRKADADKLVNAEKAVKATAKEIEAVEKQAKK